jgi:hypothetical protein
MRDAFRPISARSPGASRQVPLLPVRPQPPRRGFRRSYRGSLGRERVAANIHDGTWLVGRLCHIFVNHGSSL